MANNSVESLLAWMKEGAQTYEWDAIIALSSDSVNESLQREYTRRLSEGTEWQLADTVIEIPETNLSHHFQGIKIGPPLLSFALTGFEQPDTALRLPIQAGTALMISRYAGVDSVVKVTAYDPRNGPQLRLDLQPWPKLASAHANAALHKNLLRVEADKNALVYSVRADTQTIGVGGFVFYRDMPCPAAK